MARHAAQPDETDTDHSWLLRLVTQVARQPGSHGACQAAIQAAAVHDARGIDQLRELACGRLSPRAPGLGRVALHFCRGFDDLREPGKRRAPRTLCGRSIHQAGTGGAPCVTAHAVEGGPGALRRSNRIDAPYILPCPRLLCSLTARPRTHPCTTHRDCGQRARPLSNYLVTENIWIGYKPKNSYNNNKFKHKMVTNVKKCLNINSRLLSESSHTPRLLSAREAWLVEAHRLAVQLLESEPSHRMRHRRH